METLGTENTNKLLVQVVCFSGATFFFPQKCNDPKHKVTATIITLYPPSRQ